jgi:hypothetical protein
LSDVSLKQFEGVILGVEDGQVSVTEGFIQDLCNPDTLLRRIAFSD